MAFLRCDAGMTGWRRTAGPEHERVAHEGLVETGEFKVSPHDLMHGVDVRVGKTSDGVGVETRSVPQWGALGGNWDELYISRGRV